MNRTVLIVSALVLIVIGAAVGGFLWFTNDAPTTEPTTNSPFGGIQGGDVTPGAIERISISDAEGRPVQVADFKLGRTPVEFAGDTYYDLLERSSFDDGSASFSIQYAEKTSLFSIVLVAEPLSTARFAAEDYLGDLLGLSEDDLCQLNIVVTVDGDVSEVYGDYDDLGLSFCETPVQLP